MILHKQQKFLRSLCHSVANILNPGGNLFQRLRSQPVPVLQAVWPVHPSSHHEQAGIADDPGAGILRAKTLPISPIPTTTTGFFILKDSRKTDKMPRIQ
jgi:hypothetical protein